MKFPICLLHFCWPFWREAQWMAALQPWCLIRVFLKVQNLDFFSWVKTKTNSNGSIIFNREIQDSEKVERIVANKIRGGGGVGGLMVCNFWEHSSCYIWKLVTLLPWQQKYKWHSWETILVERKRVKEKRSKSNKTSSSSSNYNNNNTENKENNLSNNNNKSKDFPSLSTLRGNKVCQQQQQHQFYNHPLYHIFHHKQTAFTAITFITTNNSIKL